MELKPLILKEKDKILYNTLELYTVLAFSSKPYATKVIDRIFNEDKIRYITAYKNSHLYGHNATKTMPYELQIYTERAIGIVEDCINRSDFSNLEELYKNCYRKYYNTFKHMGILTFDDISFIAIDKKKKKYENERDAVEFQYKLFSSLYVFGFLRNMDLDNCIPEHYKDMFRKAHIEEYKYAWSGTQESLDNLLNKYKKNLGIKDKTTSLSVMVNEVIKTEKDKLREVESVKAFIYNKEIDDILYELSVSNNSLNAYDNVLRFFGIDSLELRRITSIKKEDIEGILIAMEGSLSEQLFNGRDFTILFMTYLNLCALAKEYNKLKESYVKNVNEDFLFEIEEEKNKYKSALREVSELKENITIREKIVKDRENALNKEVNDLRRENNNLKEKLEEYEILKKEVAKFRELSFKEDNQDNNEEEIIDLLSDEQIKALNKLNISIVGGSLSWIKKLKEVLPDWTYISTDNINNDLSILRNTDFIFINTKMSHSLYYKAKSVIDKNDLKYDYINVSSNIDISLNSIYELINQNNLI